MRRRSHIFSSSASSLFNTNPTSFAGTHCIQLQRKTETQQCEYLLYVLTRFMKLNRANNT